MVVSNISISLPLVGDVGDMIPFKFTHIFQIAQNARRCHLSKVSRIYVSEEKFELPAMRWKQKRGRKISPRRGQKLITGIQVLQLEPGSVDLKQASGSGVIHVLETSWNSSLPNKEIRVSG